MYEQMKRPYKYRERPYNYRENLIREESRSRKNRKQLIFTDIEYATIQNRMLDFGTDNFSEYVRYCLYNKEVKREQVVNFVITGKNTQRKQICFNDDELIMINNAMEHLGINNFNLYIKLITM